MKKCPNCNELVGDNVCTCFNCHYDFITRYVPSVAERQKQAAKRNDQERNKIPPKNDGKYVNSIEARSEQLATFRPSCIAGHEYSMSMVDTFAPILNDSYEYNVVPFIVHSYNSSADSDMAKLINEYARAGWRLVSTVSGPADSQFNYQIFLYFERRYFSPRVFLKSGDQSDPL